MRTKRLVRSNTLLVTAALVISVVLTRDYDKPMLAYAPPAQAGSDNIQPLDQLVSNLRATNDDSPIQLDTIVAEATHSGLAFSNDSAEGDANVHPAAQTGTDTTPIAGVKLSGSALSALVSYWAFDEGTGAVAHDSWGADNGTIHGATWTSGVSGTALHFDGLDDYVEVLGPLTLGEFTFSAWVKIPDIGINNKKIFHVDDGAGHVYYLQGNSGNALSLGIDTAEVNEYDWSFQPGVWTHVAMTYDGRTLQAYRNGEKTEVGEIESVPVTGPLLLGGLGEVWDGEIDEVALFNRVLTDAEMQNVYCCPGIPTKIVLSLDVPSALSLEQPTWIPITIDNVELADDVRNLEIRVEVSDSTIIEPAFDLRPRMGSLFPTTSLTAGFPITGGWSFLLNAAPPPAVPISGTGVVVELPFQGIAEGCVEIGFTDHILLDSDGQPVPHNAEGDTTCVTDPNIWRVTGTVYLENRTTGHYTGTTITLPLPTGTVTTTTAADGRFTLVFGPVPSNVYAVQFRRHLFVDAVRQIRIGGTSVTPMNEVGLWAGDLDGDNDVTHKDWRLCAAASTSRLPPYDINADGVTDVGDCTLLSNNIDRADMSSTNPPWTNGWKVFLPAVAHGYSGEMLHVRAYIDGRSLMIVQPDRLYWHHVNYEAPGRPEGLDLPTYLDGEEWYPSWPDVPDARNSFCDCDSSSYEELDLSTMLRTRILLQTVEARYRVSIIQQPSAENGYTLIIEFDDDPEGGAAWYEVNLLGE